ncbi:MAG: arsenosugar biosynthesis radical SAM protein ArsS [Humidesulfovibrio sp.]|nr:arsenosugar biosynthesis radical SAM protein ArsS [Humidesulfovibrio sp.]
MEALDFAETLARQGLELRKGRAECLQVNVGALCNLSCRHCHLEAGPERTDVMSRATMDEVIALARRAPFATVDVTGGAPELNPDIVHLLKGLGPLAAKRIFRTNLLALEGKSGLMALLLADGWSIGASLPAVNAGQVESIRGAGVFERSLDMLRQLNALGYGQAGGPELHLVSNPAGAFLPPAQHAATRTFRQALERRAISFNSLFVFANVPLGRFQAWLTRSGNLDAYMQRLRQGFNPEVVCGLMCRAIVSVAWDGALYDCDFNLAAGLPSNGPRHLRDYLAHQEGAAIPVGEHCFACTAGSGFT